ncbi:acetyl-CoA carboxylase biotin carboxylase subunit [Bradyrhizobium sp. BWA-3-5]|uniref:acetyl-CoA carboxylase biotin carboxylase subunit n=1 Tax=Bradyrhizobium sp. BWA-3-5 TaxID=3080013 RepID=UPI00293E7C96|nr:acetyl-CoA carboxylase biotin carboxylase subunit [Bradyrhizobium sp. BWA-3-5]WOH63754.1 acetyl-CoA carboxylase biotin carboxylase subunit [Bradyrhizobium sp. BWA-3-5]
MFDKLLIANRGEIALRIQRACKALGIGCVQAYSEADTGADYVRTAEQAICVGAAPSSRSYLDKAAMLLAAEVTGAQAIHPGYGFLSENAEFARWVEEAGLIFVGPLSGVIRRMGDKICAKRAMIEAGVPCVPGFVGELTATRDALEIIRSIGFPVIIKAAGGGGGRGMRVVREEKDLMAAIAATQQEAEKAFANGTVYVERYLDNPRHVEIQILADKYGNCVWLGARDCSVQRRHQKVIEEAPPVDVPQRLLADVGSRCVAACKALGYVGLGTFEFLFEDNQLFFIEMNTRLQVEHTVTEMITGLDLVQYQLRVARGERLDIEQKDISFVGHSIECRINAEDPLDFRPSPGRVDFWQPPGGPGLRVDTHVSSGYVVPAFYDSMIAKLISFGRTREEAIARMQGGLRQFVVEGIKTNIPLHLSILEQDKFRKGAVSIHFLEKWLASK